MQCYTRCYVALIIMTDLQNMISMISKSDEEFTKYKSGDDWKVCLNNREVYILFDKDGNFKFMAKVL